jgi:hypothetical protein
MEEDCMEKSWDALLEVVVLWFMPAPSVDVLNDIARLCSGEMF